MQPEISGYILGSSREHDRQQNMALLQSAFPLLVREEAIYPDFMKVPFSKAIAALSRKRTGHALTGGELGCLLGHRRIWRRIAAQQDDKKMFLVLESDSAVKDLVMIETNFGHVSETFDIFFWGAWEGHMKLFRSSKTVMPGGYSIGEPFIKTVYCTYGYSLNRKAASYLLKQTGKVNFPVDQFKKFIGKGALRIGGVEPELIETNGKRNSYIQKNRNSIREFFLWLFLDFRNGLICLLK
jgi:GR25 family glycosyltransferase involved in LPS biosynthesis